MVGECIDTMSLPLGWEYQHSSSPSFVTWGCYCGFLRVTTHWHKGPSSSPGEHLLNLFWCKISKVSTVQFQTSCMQMPLPGWVWGAPLLALLPGGNFQHRNSGVQVKSHLQRECGSVLPANPPVSERCSSRSTLSSFRGRGVQEQASMTKMIQRINA